MNACITRETFVFTVLERVIHSTLKLKLCRHACRRRDPIILTCRYGINMPTTALIMTQYEHLRQILENEQHLPILKYLSLNNLRERIEGILLPKTEGATPATSQILTTCGTTFSLKCWELVFFVQCVKHDLDVCNACSSLFFI